MSLIQYYGTGKRKSSIARVFLRSGKGDITLFVNKRPRPYSEYFRLDAYKVIIRQPLLLTETEDKFDMFLRVSGGGAKGQAEAIRLGHRPGPRRVQPRAQARAQVGQPADARRAGQRAEEIRIAGRPQGSSVPQALRGGSSWFPLR